jgi:hypothetical protein
MKRLLVLMAKQPLVGASKTRLAPLLSHPQAAQLAHCFLLDKLAQMRQVPQVTRAIAYAPATAQAFFADLAPDCSLLPQEGENLGQRLQHVVGQAFELGYQQVVAIDGDTVTLPSEYLCQAFEALEHNEVSLGPCEDGGYYAIGMRLYYPTLFEVKMSTPQVLQDTLEQATLLKLAVQMLPMWYDVDTPADLIRLAHDLQGAASPTADYLRQLRLV